MGENLMTGDNLIQLSDANFDEEVIASEQPVLVDFWAEWCGPCHMIAPVVAEIAAEYKGRISVGKLNVDENPVVAAKYGIRSIPSILLFKDGQVNQQIVGAVPKMHLTSMLDQAL